MILLVQEVVPVNQCAQDRFPGDPPEEVRKLHLLEARNVGGAHPQVGVQQPLDLVEHFEQRASQVPAHVVPGGALRPYEHQLLLRPVSGQRGPVVEQQHGGQCDVLAEGEPFEQFPISEAG